MEQVEQIGLDTGPQSFESQYLQRFYWCPGPDLNRHDLNGRGILSPLCLPISPPGRSAGKGGREGYHARAQSQAPRDRTQLKVSDC